MFAQVGQFIKRVRESRGMKAKDVAERAKMRPAQFSHLQKGGNAAWSYFDDAARAMGFRSALDMFTSGGDAETARLLRIWRALPDDGARTELLRAARGMLDADGE